MPADLHQADSCCKKTGASARQRSDYFSSTFVRNTRLMHVIGKLKIQSHVIIIGVGDRRHAVR